MRKANQFSNNPYKYIIDLVLRLSPMMMSFSWESDRVPSATCASKCVSKWTSPHGRIASPLNERWITPPRECTTTPLTHTTNIISIHNFPPHYRCNKCLCKWMLKNPLASKKCFKTWWGRKWWNSSIWWWAEKAPLHLNSPRRGIINRQPNQSRLSLNLPSSTKRRSKKWSIEWRLSLSLAKWAGTFSFF